VSEYRVVREKASAEHRDIERALTRFIAKTGDTENLFPDDPYAFPCKFLLSFLFLAKFSCVGSRQSGLMAAVVFCHIVQHI